jgi:ectoine hydroxylase-related dioxygenase (phytanoyl-CoA dioxygenase family)
MKILEWEMEPGDAVAFNYGTLHGARGNSATSRRRAFSLRLVGDDARVVDRPGPTSPPFPGHNMQAGEHLREDWFPTIFKRSE